MDFPILKILLLIIVTLPVMAAETGVPLDPHSDPVAEVRRQTIAKAIVGAWSAAVGSELIKLRFEPEGAYDLNGEAGTYAVEASTVLLTSTAGLQSRYTLKLPVVNNVSGQQLELSAASLPQPLLFSREREAADFVASMLAVSQEDMQSKTTRITIVLTIVVLAWALTLLLKAASDLMIFSERGPLRHLYTRHKHRTRTIHSLVINICKYLVYFTALGLILTEFGVNYTAYLASLSVIGLAIGFGSQGLVQDMVTGFFVIFESQYDVGDMVEISGQIGIVEELGLRMTRIRNYLGQRVVIPNRNIATVGRFHKGAQHVTIDVSCTEEDESAAGKLLQTVVEEVAIEFRGVIIGSPTDPSPLVLATGERFLRSSLVIWPQQTWIVDQQLLPRIREQFSGAGITIPGDRIVPFYHAREEIEVGPSRMVFATGSPNE